MLILNNKYAKIKGWIYLNIIINILKLKWIYLNLLVIIFKLKDFIFNVLKLKSEYV